MKVWELEEGKIYVCDDNESLYKIVEEKLYYTRDKDCIFTISCLHYNDIININFVEYIEPVDWSKVKVDTKVIANGVGKRHFSHFKNGKVYLFSEGRTSWSCYSKNDIIERDKNIVSLYKEPTEEIEQKPTEKQITTSVPYEVGDSIYHLCGNEIREYKINKMEVVIVEVSPVVENHGYTKTLTMFHSNSTTNIFATREEAENKLKEMKGE